MIKTCLIAYKRPKRPLFLTAVMSFTYLISLLFPMYVSMCVCLSVCPFPRREVISQPILKCDISKDAYSQREGVSKNRFKIKPDVGKLFRKNLITHGRHHVLAQKCTHWCGIRLPSTCPNFKEIDQKLLFLWAYLSFVIFQNIDIFQGSTKAGGNTSYYMRFSS